MLTAENGRRPHRDTLKRVLAANSPLILLAGLCIVLAVVSENFRQPDNLQRVLQRTCVVGIIAIGQTMVIISGGIDLSVGSVAALSGVVAALAMVKAGMPMPVGLAAGAFTGLFCGLLNGLFSTKGGIPAFIATLGMMMVARGGTLLLTEGRPIFGLPESFRYLGGTRGWWIPVAIMAAIMVAFAITLSFTPFGRRLYATGGNAQGARLSGIPIDRVRIAAFALSGLLTGFAGCILTARTSVAEPTAAEGMELDAIAACVIGGASLMGGEGGVVGAVAGALIMEVLVNFCNLTDFNVYWQYVLVGSLIILLVWYDSWRKRRAGMTRT